MAKPPGEKWTKPKKGVGKKITAKQRAARKRNMAIARAARSKGTKKKVPGMRGTAKVPKGMRISRGTGTRLYPA